MRKIGYTRASTSTQNLDRQIAALRAERCHEVYREKASGRATKGRPQLERVIDALGTGDVLVVAEWDRATCSMMDGVHIIERIHARGAMIKVFDKLHLDLTTPIGRGFIAFLLGWWSSPVSEPLQIWSWSPSAHPDAEIPVRAIAGRSSMRPTAATQSMAMVALLQPSAARRPKYQRSADGHSETATSPTRFGGPFCSCA